MSRVSLNFFRSIFGSRRRGRAVAALLLAANEAYALRRLKEAANLYRRAIALDNSRAEIFYKLGNTLKEQGLLTEAIAHYSAAIERDSAYMQAYCNRGAVLHRLGDLSAAGENFDQAIAIDPADSVSHYNKALLLQDRSDLRDALASYDTAVRLNPYFADAQYNRALLLLSLGDFKNGWRAYEWRWKVADRLSIGRNSSFREPLWLGDQPIDGRRLLLHCEGGLGDTIQFSRYVTLCSEQGARVSLQVPAPLLPLLRSLRGASEIVADKMPLPQFDLHCPLMSLPLAFRTTTSTVPFTSGYISADASLIRDLKSRLGNSNKPRIGLAWSGNPRNWIDLRRSIRLSQWLPHLSSRFEYYCLQTEIREEDHEALASSSIKTISGLDFATTAALCLNLDLIISVDTSLAHLGGALGHPTWLLLPTQADWRWLQNRDDSPWYDSVRLYRQSESGAWPPVLAQVSRDLESRFCATGDSRVH